MFGLNFLFRYAMEFFHLPSQVPLSFVEVRRVANRTPVRANMVTLDTETTGLGINDQIISITVTSMSHGSILFHTLLKPSCPIHPEAAAINGYTVESLKNAPSFADIYQPLAAVLENKELIIYNAKFDTRMLDHSCIDAGLPRLRLRTQCLMLDYANYFGECHSDSSRLGLVWQRLVSAAAQLRIDISDLEAHNSIDDCEIVRRVYLTLRAKTLSGDIKDAPPYWSN
jgi:DNA polymerase-3 subunit epsilon